MRIRSVFCVLVALSVFLVLPVSAFAAETTYPGDWEGAICFSPLSLPEGDIVDFGYVGSVVPGKYDCYFLARDDEWYGPFSYSLTAWEARAEYDGLFVSDMVAETDGGPLVVAHLVDARSLAGCIIFLPVGSLSVYEICLVPIDSDPILSGALDGIDLHAVLDEFVDLLPVTLPVLIGYIGVKKGISWLLAQIRQS